MNWVKHEHGYLHRPWWKVVINTALRMAQSGRKHRWLVVTKVDFESLLRGSPVVTGYGFAKVEFKDAP